MKEIINSLRNDADNIKRMIKATPPSNWSGTQKQWELSQKEKMKNLYKAARILEATL